MTKAEITVLITEKTERLNAYKARELQMLSSDGVKAYGIGSRNLQRYDTALADIQKMIKELEEEIAELKSQLNGGGVRKAVGIIPRDW